jgi:hypothetical protein
MSILDGFLENLGQGLGNPKGNLGDFTHAARLYNDSAFRLAPKTKFLYHVVFNLNPNALAGTNFKEQHQSTVGLLVKAIDLPRFKITVDVAQQYNRKRAQQTKLEYDPVSITFHDDNLGITTALWSLYYGYYFADSSHGGGGGAGTSGSSGVEGFLKSTAEALIPGVNKLFSGGSDTAGSSDSAVPTGYARHTTYEKDNYYRYGLDRDSSVPFFSTIQIFQLSKQQYQSFTLVNPIITGWQHDSLDNSQGAETAANKMTIQYEAVIYGQGKISTGNPTGFAQEFYDKSPSPLSLLGGGKVGLFGQGGILGGAVDIVGGIASGSAFSSAGALLGTLIKGAAVVNNAKKLTSEGIRQEGFNLLTGAITSATGVNVNGVANVLFPKSGGAGQNDFTAANQTQITQGTGPLPSQKVTAFFNARPGALNSLARTVVFAKAIGAGTLTEINTAWNALSLSAQQNYESKALEKVINGAPEVQSQYQLIKNQVINGNL